MNKKANKINKKTMIRLRKKLILNNSVKTIELNYN